MRILFLWVFILFREVMFCLVVGWMKVDSGILIPMEWVIVSQIDEFFTYSISYPLFITDIEH